MTAVYTPEGIATPDVVSGMLKKGVVIAAGLHKDIKSGSLVFATANTANHNLTQQNTLDLGKLHVYRWALC
jgi:hypothetical protein